MDAPLRGCPCGLNIPDPTLDGVVAGDKSRLSRNEGETAGIIKILRFCGVHVFFVSQGIDTAENQPCLTVGVYGGSCRSYRVD